MFTLTIKLILYGKGQVEIGRKGYCLQKVLNDVSSSKLRFWILMTAQYLSKKSNLGGRIESDRTS